MARSIGGQRCNTSIGRRATVVLTGSPRLADAMILQQKLMIRGRNVDAPVLNGLTMRGICNRLERWSIPGSALRA